MMTQLFDDPGLKDKYRYAGHNFIDKKKAPGCQAADILAWQWYTQRKRKSGAANAKGSDRVI
jgi:hypothetical protein